MWDMWPSWVTDGEDEADDTTDGRRISVTKGSGKWLSLNDMVRML